LSTVLLAVVPVPTEPPIRNPHPPALLQLAPEGRGRPAVPPRPDSTQDQQWVPPIPVGGSWLCPAGDRRRRGVRSSAWTRRALRLVPGVAARGGWSERAGRSRRRWRGEL